ncbi:beta-galactosidase [Plantibacter sp. Leaf171]|uniref:beta-galactosidase n=1 Tax=unclassified Plantibacter TaxID=2624265 RepID=UPI0006F226E4|nr:MULTISPECIES: beta-galactosidase [unclassified Plantibacter]KQM16679.1 beta-galactosidase [Plantibacter sp. Leaf1]KQR59815.1 beta-galactosidase [Plantibacter sp. Leaf171]
MSSTPTFSHDGIAYGCDYNPEQWDRSVWREDVALMQEAGVDLVALNIFGWSHLEPRPGEFEFSGLDEILDLLHAAGIRVNLGTGTASAPPWLTFRHPEILPETEDGTTRFPGGRQAWCPSSAVFRRYALELVERVAERYGAHPAVELWHVSNELGCHNALCYDDESAEAFRGWLRARYGTIERLNTGWGTSFWSQQYSDFAEILPPRLTLSSRNPSQVVDFHRFSSDELLDYYRAELEVLRRHSTVPVTTNFMVTAHIRNMDYWQWAPEMDVVANDHYLDNRLADPTAELSFASDLTRGLAGGGSWLLMEQSTGAVNWQPQNLAKAPGEMTRNSLTHVAKGAEAVCFFQWRASLQGSEKFHSALLPHAGTDSDVWREVVALGGTLDRLDEIVGTRVQADVALMFSWENWWAADGESRPTHAVDYLSQVHAAHASLRRLGHTVDVVRPGADLSAYRLVVIPNLYLVRDSEAAVVSDFVAAGGHAVITFFSGIADEEDRVRPGGYPGAFRELLGVNTEEFAPVLPGQTLTLASGKTATAWSERTRARGAEVLDTFTDGPSIGRPAITRNRIAGGGDAWYLATNLDADALDDVLRDAAAGAGAVPQGDEQLPGLEVIRRVGDDRSYRFLINHSTHDVELPATGHELVTGEPVDSIARVPAGAVRVIREDRTR